MFTSCNRALAVLVSAALGVLGSVASAAAGQASLTRIEPRAFYGATITLEEGVRVFRPLPRTRQMIINPGNKTPLNLSIEDRRYTYTHHNYNYGGGGERSYSSGGGSYGTPFYSGVGGRDTRRGRYGARHVSGFSGHRSGATRSRGGFGRSHKGGGSRGGSRGGGRH